MRKTLSMAITNAQGVKIDSKIIVIESDDWGSIRIPNKVVKDKFEKKGYKFKKNGYYKFDTLANEEDLSRLFSTLLKFKDKNGNHPVITANTVVANPNFEKIKHSNYTQYSYKPFTTTLKEYYPSENVFKVWEEGRNAKIFIPQYHGREHVNVPIWLRELQANNQVFLDAFDLGFWGIPKELYDYKTSNIQAAYCSNKPEHIDFYKNSITEGLKLFEEIFGFKSKTFIANNYTWSPKLNQILYDNGVIGIQGMKYQKTPTAEDSGEKLIPLHTGKQNDLGQIYMVRNCVFEPSQMPKSYNNIKNCLREIESAFLFKKPAIITSHRLNYIGAISTDNREINLDMFEKLINKILERWPDAIFMTSEQLVNHLRNKQAV